MTNNKTSNGNINNGDSLDSQFPSFSGFSKWKKWEGRDQLEGIMHPGVYAIAITTEDISNTDFSWCDKIVYIGFSHAKGGLKSRLNQFDNTLKGGPGHGGADRVILKYSDRSDLVKKLYVSISYSKDNEYSNTPKGLRIKGDVRQYEYYCLAVFVERVGKNSEKEEWKLPEFNDMKRSPKASKKEKSDVMQDN
jgi:hypothetical protein